MNSEYYALITMTLLFLFAWIPSSVAKFQSFGGKWLASNRTPIPGKELSRWGQRVERAHNNLKDNFPGFVVAILLLGLRNQFSDATSVAAWTYVGARLIHFASYGIGHVNTRFLSYVVGLGANLYLLAKILIG